MPDMTVDAPKTPHARKPEKLTPPSSPMLGNMVSASPVEPDDIADPPVPAGTVEALGVPQEPRREQGVVQETPPPPTPAWADHEALLHGFCQALQHKLTAFLVDESKGMLKTLDALMAGIQRWTDAVAQYQTAVQQHNMQAQAQWSAALRTLQEQGLQLRHDPYTATVQALAPSGFPVTIQVAKGQAGELCQAIEGLTAWLLDTNYTPPPVAYAGTSNEA
jgi:hypothetical protein